MKQFLTLLLTGISVGLFAQNEVKVSEETQPFSVGSKNSIVVTIPYGKTDIAEKALKSELKDWNGKYNSSKGEYTTMQASFKAMGPKAFDAYARIISTGDVVKVAVAVDLGGAYLTSREHKAQYDAMVDRLKAFAIKTGKECVAEELKAEQKVLSTLEKEQKDLEKEKESMLKSIEDYKKKISETENKIGENTSNQSKKKEEITKQTEKISAVDKKKNIK